MFELSALQTEDVAGGFSWGEVIQIGKWGVSFAEGYMEGIGALGQTLSNYYGEEMTLQIINGGNLGA